MSDDRRYRFDQLDRMGVILGLSGLQLAFVGLGLLGVASLISLGVPGPVAMLPLASAAAGAFTRLGGRPIVEALPVALRWLLPNRPAARSWFARIPRRTSVVPIDLPPPLHGLRLVEHDSPWHRVAKVGLIEDRVDRTLTVLVPVRGRDFALINPDEQGDLLGRWGEVLATFARERGLVVRLSWSEFAAPVGLSEHLSWLEDRAEIEHHEAQSTEASRSYAALLADVGELASEHQVVVALTVSRSRLRAPGGGRSSRSPTAFLDAAVGAATTLLRGLHNAGLEPGTPMTVNELVTVLGWRTEAARMRRRLRSRTPTACTSDSKSVGPLAMKVAWKYLRLDGSMHRTFWIAEWPRLPVRADWFELLLAFNGGARRAITVVYEPVAPSASRRRIDSESIKLESDAITREEKGRRVTAQHRRNQVAVAEREQELVAGFVEFDYTGLITVSADTDAELWDGCDHIEQLCREHGLELRALDGRHDVAWAAALPFGLGVNRRLGR